MGTGKITEMSRLEEFPDLQAFVRDQYFIDWSVELPIPFYKINLYRRRHDNEAPSTQRGLPLK
jgi:hypothetical protein